ncbi:MAG: phosphatidate cytidylyltransferase [Acetivibrio ethanolgignens]
MFGTRLISGIVLMIVTVAVMVLGGDVLFWTVAVISLIGLFELYRTVGIHKSFMGYVAYLGSLCFDLLILFSKESGITHLIIGLLMLFLIIYVLAYPRYNSEHVTMAFFGIFYVTVMLSYIYRVRMLEDGHLLVWLIFIGAWGSDTCAYCVGMLIGKHHLPAKLSALSPKKSIEGCIGGVVGAALLGFLYALLVKNGIAGVQNPELIFAIIGGASSVISQLGDWTASAIKRNHNIKDYGHLIPGHGGILDRFDSIIFTAPIVYFLAELL